MDTLNISRLFSYLFVWLIHLPFSPIIRAIFSPPFLLLSSSSFSSNKGSIGSILHICTILHVCYLFLHFLLSSVSIFSLYSLLFFLFFLWLNTRVLLIHIVWSISLYINHLPSTYTLILLLISKEVLEASCPLVPSHAYINPPSSTFTLIPVYFPSTSSV